MWGRAYGHRAKSGISLECKSDFREWGLIRFQEKYTARFAYALAVNTGTQRVERHSREKVKTGNSPNPRATEKSSQGKHIALRSQ
jgi:hypothetical protein